MAFEIKAGSILGIFISNRKLLQVCWALGAQRSSGLRHALQRKLEARIMVQLLRIVTDFISGRDHQEPEENSSKFGSWSLIPAFFGRCFYTCQLV